MDIREAIKKLSNGTDKRNYATLAVVREIDLDTLSCSVEPVLNSDFDIDVLTNTDNWIYDVKLIPFVSDTLNYNVPKVGSYIVCYYLNDYDAFITNITESTNITQTTLNTSIIQSSNLNNVDDSNISGSFIKLISDNIIQFNNGDNFGMVKVQKLTQKLNAIENKLNEVINLFNLHIHLVPTATPLPPATAAITAPTTTSGIPLTPITQQSDIENPDIIH